MIKKVLIYPILVIMLLTGACRRNGASAVKEKRINPNFSTRRVDKIPYGTYYAFENLPYIFPEAEIVTNRKEPGDYNIFSSSKNELQTKIAAHGGKTVQFFITPRMEPDQTEMNALMNFVYSGNHLFISTYHPGKALLGKLEVETFFKDGGYDFRDSMKVHILNPVSSEFEKYVYPGKSNSNFFTTLNEKYVTVLGRNETGNPNFIRVSYDNGGSVYLHLAPSAFTNFFLLHKRNKSYYDCALSYLPSDTELVIWDEYYRTKEDSNSTSRAFGWMMKQPPLAAALWLLMLLFLLIYLFESKRKQRIVPVRPPLKNASLDFVKTIGQLYYQRHDNKNLASKMTAHFLDYVRSRFNITGSRMDEQLGKKLAFKTGIDSKMIEDIIYQSNYLANQSSVTDTELLFYNHQLQNFYKQAK